MAKKPRRPHNVPNVLHGDEARRRLTAGADIISRTLGLTLGPGGRNIVVEKAWRTPLTTKDGVTVAREIDLAGRHEHMGAMFVREASRRTVEAAGDGTTTAAVLCGALLRHAQKLAAVGADPMALARGMRSFVEPCCSWIQDNMCRSVDASEDLHQVAMLASNGDTDIAEGIVEAMESVGQHGIVHIAKSSRSDPVTCETASGLWFEQGWTSWSLLNGDEQAAGKVEFTRPLVILLGDEMASAMGIICIMEAALRVIKQWQIEQPPRTGTEEEREPSSDPAPRLGYGGLLIVGEVTGDAMSTIVQNRRAGQLDVCVVKPPWAAGGVSGRLEALDDIATATGARVLSAALGRPPTLALSEEGVQRAQASLGVADHVEVRQRMTVLGLAEEDLQGSPLEPRVLRRLGEITAMADRAAASGKVHSADRLRSRASRLGGGVATLHIGGVSRLEVDERAYRAEDALCAVRAAIEHGISPGGGAALLRCSAAMRTRIEWPMYDEHQSFRGLSEDEQLGAVILLDAMSVPFKLVMRNADAGAPGVLAARLRKDHGFDRTIDVESGDIVDAWQAGIYDPTIVVLRALRAAVSTAGSAMEVECSVHPARRTRDEG